MTALRPPLDPHALARSIVGEPRFRIAVIRPKPKTWWDVLLQWLSDRWTQLIDAFSKHVHVGEKASVAIGDLLIFALIALVAIVAIRLFLSSFREPAGVFGSARPLAQTAGADSLYALSERAADRGDYAAAIVLLFRAALAALDVHGVVHDDPSHTVNECRRAVRERSPQSAHAFDTIARAFTDALYADVPVSPQQWMAARNAFADVAPDSHGDAA